MRYDAESRTIVLDWRGVPEGRVQVYRSINEGRPGLIGSLSSDSSGYVDRELLPGATYQYRLKVVTPDGGESLMVESVPVTIES